MDESEFDEFAREYDQLHAAAITVSGEAPAYFAEYKIQDIARECLAAPCPGNRPPDILDFGAGVGGSVPHVSRYFAGANLTCLDPSRRSLEVAEKRFPDQAHYVHFDGSRIPFPADHFDLAYAMCVFHHIDGAEHVALLRELHRVIRPGGRLFVFEHNPFNPLTLRVVNQCPFDRNARLIKAADLKRELLSAGFAGARIRYRVFFPHLLRVLRPAERWLTWLPLGGQYYTMSYK